MPQVPELPVLSDEVTAAYQRILDGEPLQPDTPGLDSLMTSGLAVRFPQIADTYTPVEPGIAALHMMAILHAQLAAVTQYAQELPEFLVNLRDRFQASMPPAGSVQHLVGRTLINQRIHIEHSGARTDIITAQPSPRSSEDLAYSSARDYAALQRGLSMRTLYHSSVRRVASVGDWAKHMADGGGEIRTMSGRFPRIIVFDRRVAFVPVYRNWDEGEPPADEAVMISDPRIAAQISHVFDLFWERADLWMGGSNGDANLQTNSTQRAILRELCMGRNQKQAAKNLGISSAWVNDQLRELRLTLGVGTLNEVIYWWARSPDHTAND